MPPPLPVPGLLLGDYPEREQARSSVLPERLLAWLDALPPLQQLQIRKLSTRARRVLALQQALTQLAPAQRFGARLLRLRATLRRDGLTSPAAEHACASVASAIQSALGLQPRENQIMTAFAVLAGQLAELPTGEGKSLATGLAAGVAALAGVPVHVVSSNDYLAGRDARACQTWAGLLGLRASAISPGMDEDARRAAYAADITFCSAHELVFDYLRDRQRTEPATRVLRGLCMAIVDEADSVFIDEAATPFILAETADQSAELAACVQALRLARRMQAGFDYRIDRAARSVRLTEQGRELLATDDSAHPPLWALPRYRVEMVERALHALHLLQRDVHYLVQDGRLQLIDASSGRLADGRSWSRGLQQLVEMKERCTPSQATRTVAQISFPRFFTRYHLLGGLSGTLSEARGELREAYGLRVCCIPPARASQLQILPPRVALTAQTRWRAVVDAIRARHALGQPVLVGTDSVFESEHLAALLAAAGLPCRVLNARQDADEAALVAEAGAPGAITVSTNMAGRGTDIPVSTAVAALGGLHVLSCQHNSARRIDRQLFGRTARQGQPGSAQSFLALDEGLLGRHLSLAVRRFLRLLSRRDEHMPLVIARALLRYAQAREEYRARQARARLRSSDARAAREGLFGRPPDRA